MSSLQQMAQEALERDKDRPALEFGGAWYSWGELAVVANRIATLLLQIGVAPGAPVAFIARNRPAALAALLALVAQGRTIRMIYAFQSAAGMARDIRRSPPGALIADTEDLGAELVGALAAQGIPAIALEGMAVRTVAGTEGTDVTVARHAGDPQIEILTSGTTGPPKPFAVSYRIIEKHFIDSALARHQGTQPDALPPFLLYFPLGNITGIYTTLPMLLRGQRIVLLERFALPAWHDFVKRFRPAHSGLPPSFVQQVMDNAIPPEDLTSLKALGVGAAPLDPHVQQAFEDRYKIPILVSYGATEFAGPVAAMTLELHAEYGRQKRGTVGRPMAGVQLRIVDAETGMPLPPGQEGLLEVVSPRLGPDWIRTADVGVIDTDGFLFLHGRADGAIMRGGFKVLPESIERALMLHPDIAEAAVTGIADRRLGQVPVAVIRPKPGVPAPPADALDAHLRERILATHIPVSYLVCEEIPRTPSLKVDRQALARLFRPA